MRVEIATKKVELHETPLEEISVSSSRITVTFDDSDGRRWKVVFCPYQGMKVTTIDCADTNLFLIDGRRPLYLLEVFDSPWMKKLSEMLKQKDHTADFMLRAHHYVLPCQDNLVEVVAWDNFSLEEEPNR